MLSIFVLILIFLVTGGISPSLAAAADDYSGQASCEMLRLSGLPLLRIDPILASSKAQVDSASTPHAYGEGVGSQQASGC
ncbi:hypothetical protein [Ammonifex thiophilus]|uniref:hypothetical protein n=1 Tax=Ammonifex thiophilus TaxID=444093 RepID=UPI0010693707|nr:hypothetical protein [Ammonifex thiophilus]